MAAVHDCTSVTRESDIVITHVGGLDPRRVVTTTSRVVAVDRPWITVEREDGTRQTIGGHQVYAVTRDNVVKVEAVVARMYRLGGAA